MDQMAEVILYTLHICSKVSFFLFQDRYRRVMVKTMALSSTLNRDNIEPAQNKIGQK